MHPLIHKVALVVVLTILGGCANFQKTPSTAPEPQEPEETKQQIPPMIQMGTKPLLTPELAEKVNFPPKPKDDTSPCIDAKTGKERFFLLADLKSELIPLSYSNMDRILASLEVMGLQTIESRVPNATFKPYTVDRRGKAKLLPAPKGSTHKKTKYPCS
ncbi:uncharacterized protein METZ01_LOCUS425612, partial [marine metagenome]